MGKRKVNMIGIILAVQYLSFFPSLLRGWIENMSKDGTDIKVIAAQVKQSWHGQHDYYIKVAWVIILTALLLR